MSAMWTISGLSDGRPLAAYIFIEASGSRAFPPSPYTVSVGNATRPPCLRILPALSISRRSGCAASRCNNSVSKKSPPVVRFSRPADGMSLRPRTDSRTIHHPRMSRSHSPEHLCPAKYCLCSNRPVLPAWNLYNRAGCRSYPL